ncbi:MAG: PEP-CTERM sorting domain-containing protein [Pirellulales bacterium]|nr:PEP-CTERM sorting domain-containing protein [Pirellulales bacterium]
MKSFSSLLSVSLAIAIGSAWTGQALAQHFDMFLARPATGTQTVIGGADVTGLAYDDSTRVFEVEMGELLGEFIALEPGVNHPDINNPSLVAYPTSATALLPTDVLRIHEYAFSLGGPADDLFFWNGIGPVSFAPASANFRIDGGDPLGSSPGAGGAFDDHPFLVVDSSATPGIYLAAVTGTVDGFDPSDPVYLVMGTEGLITPAFLGISQAEFDMLTEEDLDEALEGVIELGIEFVETNVLVPEPSTLALVVLSLYPVGLARFRRCTSRCRAETNETVKEFCL